MAAQTELPEGFLMLRKTLSVWPGAGLTLPAMLRVAVPVYEDPAVGLVKDTDPAAEVIMGDRTRMTATVVARSAGSDFIGAT
jgi:ABC-type arginine transport system permease subunit